MKILMNFKMVIGSIFTIWMLLITTGNSAYKISAVPSCNMILGQSIPENLTYDSSVKPTPSIYFIWNDLIKNYKSWLHIGSFYWTLLNKDVDNKTIYPSSQNGESIFKLLQEKSKTLPLDIVTDNITLKGDLNILAQNKNVKVNYMDFKHLFNSGVQHSKFMVADNKSAYIGSANIDWRSVSQIKELGVYIINCPQIVEDVERFWQILRIMSGVNSTFPKEWPSYLQPSYNYTNPLKASVNGYLSNIFIATSPPKFNPTYRTNDADAILKIIDAAKKFVDISVMDFLPLIQVYDHNQKAQYWPIIQDQLVKVAMEKGVAVRLLISYWKHSSKNMYKFLRSMQKLNSIKGINIDVKIFIIPAFNNNQRQIPFSRVSHSKYMVTDRHAYIGTSNWSGDYFLNTGGMSLVVEELSTKNLFNSKLKNLTIRAELQHVFDSDWNSIYAHELNGAFYA